MPVVQEHPTLVGDFAEFLTTLRTTDEIIQWRPSAEVQRRIEDLLLRQNEGTLEREEERELESTLQAEMMLRLLKAKLMVAKSKKRR
jgi:hypothetical protein